MVARLISAALVLVLTLTSASMAQARTAPDGTGIMVICAGHTIKTVIVDGDGQPVDPHPICPECIFSAALSPELRGWPRPSSRFLSTDMPLAATHLAPALTPRSAPPRGPPLSS